jgi:DNA repair protein RecO (recombination protein O)
MPAYTTDALILRTYKLGESDRIVVFLTRDRGKKRGVAKNARQSRRRFGGALEPLTCGRVGYVERERRDLVHLEYVEIVRSPLSAFRAGPPRQPGSPRQPRNPGDPGIRLGPGNRRDTDAGNAVALGYVGYFAELIDEWAQEADPNENLFRLGASMTDALSAGVPVEPLARYFEYWLLRLQGVYEPHARLSSEALDFLTAARGSSPFALGDVKVSELTLGELEAAHRELIMMHLEKDLKSVRVLREMRR